MKLASALVLLLVIAFASCAKLGHNVKPHFTTKTTTGDIIVTMKDHVNIKGLFQGKQSMSSDDKAKSLVENLMKKSVESSMEILTTDELVQKKYDFKILWIINGLVIKGVTFDFVEKLAKRSDVEIITMDLPYEVDPMEVKSTKPVANVSTKNDVIEYNVAWVKAPEVWKKGYTGKGMIVGVGDTGLNHKHEAIVNSYAGTKENGEFDHAYNWHDPTGRKEPFDSHGHGTHCSGTIAGGKGINRKIGVAPDAKLTHCRALASIAAQITCMQWFLAPTDLDNQNPDTNKRPHIISQSYNNWSCSPGCDENYKRATEALVTAGIAVVNSAGNRGSRCSSINPNARFPGQISIGSLQKNNNGVSRFSSRGPNPLYPTLLKPDVSAPGENVVSAASRGGYTSMSGTSMSTPNVAGGVALLWSAVPELSRKIEETNKVLYESSLGQGSSSSCKPTGTPNGDVGYGTVNYEKAIEIAQERFSARAK